MTPRGPIIAVVLAMWLPAAWPGHAQAQAPGNAADAPSPLARLADAATVQALERELAALEAAHGIDDPRVRDAAARLATELLARDLPPDPWPWHLSLWTLNVQSRRPPGPGDSPTDADWLEAAAAIATSTGNHESAEGLRRRVLEIREQSLPAGHVDIGVARVRLAASLSALGDVGEAEALARDAARILDAAPSAPAAIRAELLGTLGRVEALRGRPAEAEALYRAAFERLGGEAAGSAPALEAGLALAEFLSTQGRREEATELFGALSTPAFALGGGGPLMLRSALGVADGVVDPAECAQVGEAVTTLATQIETGTAYVPIALRMRLAETQGRLFVCAGRPQEAATRFRSAFFAFMGLHDVKNSAELGLAAARYALALGDAPEVADDAAWLASQAAWIARSRRRQGFADSDAPGFGGAVERAVHRLGGGDPLAIAFDAQLVAAWGQAGRRDLFEATYRNEAFMAAQELDISSAAHAMAQTRARTAAGTGPLSALVARQQALAAQAVALDRRLRRAIATEDAGQRSALTAELQAVDAELASLDSAVAEQFPDYEALVSPRALAINALQARMQPGEAVLLVVPSRSDVHVFAISPTDAAWHRAEGAAGQVAAHVARLRCQVDPATCGQAAAEGMRAVQSAYGDAIARGGRPFDRSVAYALYRDLVEPVAHVLEGAGTVYATTLGPLSSLPLGVLVTEPPRAGESDSDPEVLAGTAWFADRHALVTLPAISSFRAEAVATSPAPTAGDTGFIGFGDPVFGGRATGSRGGGATRADVASLRALSPLPGSREELVAMAAQFPGHAEIRMGEDATEAAVKASRDLAQARVVAFATHGLLPREARGMDEPGLVFTPPASATAVDDGLLTASEAAELSLSADWVILSACNTAADDGISGGESLSGLARAFLHAGARALLASHWRVADDATAVLTSETLAYQRTRPGATPASALQATMRAVRTGRNADGSALAGWDPAWAHPALWAPFVVVAATGP